MHCATRCEGLVATTGPITVTLPRLTRRVRIQSTGPYKCGGTLPYVRAYDQSGWPVDSGAMIITDPADCAAGNDDAGWGQTLELGNFSASIADLVISPPSPWTFPVPDPYDPSAPPLQGRT